MTGILRCLLAALRPDDVRALVKSFGPGGSVPPELVRAVNDLNEAERCELAQKLEFSALQLRNWKGR